MRLAAAKKTASIEEAVRETQVARERARGGRRGDAARRLRHPRGRGAVAVADAVPGGDHGRLGAGVPDGLTVGDSVAPAVVHSVRPAVRRAARVAVVRDRRRRPAPPRRSRLLRGAARPRSRPPRGASRPPPPCGAPLPAFDQLASGMVARSGVPGAAVAVVAGDTTMYTRCFGLRELGRPDQVDDDTLFQLGGVSQAYTTTLLAALAGEGELRWDEPVRRVWPGFRLSDRWASREATFRDLTAARSGLPAYAGSELRAFGYDRAEVLRRLRYLAPAAGFRAAYAPQDALVTAAAVGAERATGDSWARLLREFVLDPIGDDGTVTGYRGFVTALDKATPHRLVDGSMVPQDPQDETVFAPSLGVSSSLSQLVTFARLQLNGGAVGRRAGGAVGRARPGARAGDGDGRRSVGTAAAGLGWVLSSFDGRLVASAEGGLASGSSAVVGLVPDDGVAVIVLANAYPEGAALGRALTKTLIDLTVLGAAQDDWLAVEQAAVQAGAGDGDEAGAAGSRKASPEPAASSCRPSRRPPRRRRGSGARTPASTRTGTTAG